MHKAHGHPETRQATIKGFIGCITASNDTDLSGL